MLAFDPLYYGKVGLTVVAITLLKVVLVFVVGLLATIFVVWFERKVIGGMQNRIGPNKAGPFGLLQTLADGMKLIFKEDSFPDGADRTVFTLAPFLSFVPAFLVFAVVPLGGDFSHGKSGVTRWFGHDTIVQLADPPIGVLLLLMLGAIAVYGVMLGGWSSASKYPLLGSVRATAQMVSYEAALGLSLATVILVAGTLSTNGIVHAQSSFSKWHLVATGVLPFFIYLVAATAELHRPPFDLVEAEEELVSGFNTEYSSFRFALFYLAEYLSMVTTSAVVVTLFFGGPQPLKFDVGRLQWSGDLHLGFLNGTVWFALKVLLFLYLYVWIRAALPRLRYDQLMSLGWKFLIPLALAWFMLLAAFRLGQDRGWNRAVVGVVSVVVIAVAGGLLVLANRTAARNREREGAMF